MKRLALAVTVITASVVLAVPAGAHEEITPASVPTATPVFLTLSAANEKRVDVTRVTLAPPSGTQLGHATRDPAGWTTATFTHTEAVWTGGAIRPGRFEQFGFDIEPVAQPGTLAFRVILGYGDGTTDAVDVPLTVASAPGPSPTPATTADHPDEETPDPTTTPQPAADERGDGQATAALVFSLLSMLVAVGAVVLAVRSRTAAAGRARPNRPPAEQDW